MYPLTPATLRAAVRLDMLARRLTESAELNCKDYEKEQTGIFLQRASKDVFEKQRTAERRIAIELLSGAEEQLFAIEEDWRMSSKSAPGPGILKSVADVSGLVRRQRQGGVGGVVEDPLRRFDLFRAGVLELDGGKEDKMNLYVSLIVYHLPILSSPHHSREYRLREPILGETTHPRI